MLHLELPKRIMAAPVTSAILSHLLQARRKQRAPAGAGLFLAWRLSMEFREHFLSRSLHCALRTFISGDIQKAPAQPWVLSSPPAHPAGWLSHLWHEALGVLLSLLQQRTPKHPGQTVWKRAVLGSSGRIMQKQNTPFSLQLRQGVKQKIYFNTQKGC